MTGYEQLTLALVGIGGLEPSALLEQSGNAIGAAEVDALRRRGAVGDICFRFFDADGTALPSALDRRVLGIAPERLHAIPRRVGVAGGAQKYPAVRAALRGGWINVLITDAASARGSPRRSPDAPAFLPTRRPGRARDRRRLRHRPRDRARARAGRRATSAAWTSATPRAPSPTSRHSGAARSPVSADVTDESAVAAAVAAVESALGPLRLAVNSAGHRQRHRGRGHATRPVQEGDGRQPQRRLPLLSGRGPRAAAQRRRGDREHRLHVGLDRQPRSAAGPLQRVQGRRHPPARSR